MTYSPQRVEIKDFETDEMQIDGNLIQKNLELIAKETKELSNRINVNTSSFDGVNNRIRRNTKFVQAFMFG